MNMKVLWRILFVAYTAGYFSSTVGALASEGTESNLDENKSRLIRGRRDENGLRLDSFDGMSIKEENPSNDFHSSLSNKVQVYYFLGVLKVLWQLMHFNHHFSCSISVHGD